MLKNLARVVSSTTGTGTLTLGAAVSGCLNFADAGVVDGMVVSYGITDGNNSEVGRGTYTASGTTLTRDTVLASTNSGSKINCSGNEQVFITALAEDISSPELISEPAADHSASGLKARLTAGVTLNFGDFGYIASNGKVGLIDADAIATMNGLVMCIDTTINADAKGNFLFIGLVRDDTWNWTPGGLIYGTVTGTTGNTLTQTQPSGTDDVIQIAGVAVSADLMYFNPSLVQIEHI